MRRLETVLPCPLVAVTHAQISDNLSKAQRLLKRDSESMVALAYVLHETYVVSRLDGKSPLRWDCKRVEGCLTLPCAELFLH